MGCEDSGFQSWIDYSLPRWLSKSSNRFPAPEIEALIFTLPHGMPRFIANCPSLLLTQWSQWTGTIHITGSLALATVSGSGYIVEWMNSMVWITCGATQVRHLALFPGGSPNGNHCCAAYYWSHFRQIPFFLWTYSWIRTRRALKALIYRIIRQSIQKELKTCFLRGRRLFQGSEWGSCCCLNQSLSFFLGPGSTLPFTLRGRRGLLLVRLHSVPEARR